MSTNLKKDMTGSEEVEMAIYSDVEGFGSPVLSPMREHMHNYNTTECDELEDVEEVEETFAYWETSVFHQVLARLPMLICLLILQSASSIILESFTDLLVSHEVIVVYLTMLVGTGGNSGGQSAAIVLQGLASGDIKLSHLPALLAKEGTTAVILAFCIGIVGFLRTYVQSKMQSPTDTENQVSIIDCAVISIILFFIVITSIMLGTLLPLGFTFLQHVLNKYCGEQVAMFVEPSNTTFPTFQVLMDILGIAITVSIASLVYNSLGDDGDIMMG